MAKPRRKMGEAVRAVDELKPDEAGFLKTGRASQEAEKPAPRRERPPKAKAQEPAPIDDRALAKVTVRLPKALVMQAKRYALDQSAQADAELGTLQAIIAVSLAEWLDGKKASR